MSIETLSDYLRGQRDAILRIAATRNALLLGALLVLSAGFAREYDGKDLRQEPWHVAVPLAASLATSFLLFCLVFGISRLRSADRPPFASTYRSFLSLYWATAPLAWLYAIPVERFLSAGNAMRANLCFLGIVSVWRVTLMTRVIEVLFGARRRAALVIVMLFADTLVLIVLYFTPVPIFNVMGGVRLSESERIIQSTAFLIGTLGVITWPVWFVAVFATAISQERNWRFAAAQPERSHSVSWPLWALAVSTIAIWGLVLPRTQPEQRLRRAVEEAMRDGRIAEAIATMSEHQRGDFPPHWEPPPHLAYANPSPPLFDVLEAMLADGTAPWVREVYVAKLESEMTDMSDHFGSWRRRDAEYRDRLLSILERLPEGPGLVRRHEDSFKGIESNEDDQSRKDRIRALRDAAQRAAEMPDETHREIE